MATTPKGIVYPSTGEAVTPLADKFAALATSADEAITSNAKALSGPYADIPVAGTEGRTYYATDTNRSWFDDGTNWISNDGGLYLIHPASVTGGSIVNGKVVVSTTSEFTVDGVFSTRFDNYKIVLALSAPAVTTMNFNMRSGGNNNIAANSYIMSRLYTSNTNNITSITSSQSTAFTLSAVQSTNHRGVLEVFRPAYSSVSGIDSTYILGSFNSGSQISHISGSRSQLMAEDGFRLYGSAFSGTVSVYGYA